MSDNIPTQDNTEGGASAANSQWFNKESKPEPKAEKKAKEKKKGLWHEWIRPIGSVILVVLFVRGTLIDYNVVPSGSMLPNIMIGDRVLVNKLAYGVQFPLSGPTLEIPFINKVYNNPLAFLRNWTISYGDGPARGDIVTFFSPTNDKRLIKRVVAVPGDKVRVQNHIVYINDEETTVVPLDSDDSRIPQPLIPNADYTLETIPGHSQILATGDSGASFKLQNMPEITLGKDEFLMVGDHRDHSGDGRKFGPVHRSQITGRAFATLFSYDGTGDGMRWSRLARELD